MRIQILILWFNGLTVKGVITAEGAHKRQFTVSYQEY